VTGHVTQTNQKLQPNCNHTHNPATTTTTTTTTSASNKNVVIHMLWLYSHIFAFLLHFYLICLI
jgi:hypothetical protein